MNMQLNAREIATILASLRLFQQQTENVDMAEMFPDHFIDVSPLFLAEIDELCAFINTGRKEETDFIASLTLPYQESVYKTDLNQLSLHLQYAMDDGDLDGEQVRQILVDGEGGWICNINRTEDRNRAKDAFDKLQASGFWNAMQL